MNKNSTPVDYMAAYTSRCGVYRSIPMPLPGRSSVTGPKTSTLALIRQYARVYRPVATASGSSVEMILN